MGVESKIHKPVSRKEALRTGGKVASAVGLAMLFGLQSDQNRDYHLELHEKMAPFAPIIAPPTADEKDALAASIETRIGIPPAIQREDFQHGEKHLTYITTTESDGTMHEVVVVNKGKPQTVKIYGPTSDGLKYDMAYWEPYFEHELNEGTAFVTTKVRGAGQHFTYTRPYTSKRESVFSAIERRFLQKALPKEKQIFTVRKQDRMVDIYDTSGIFINNHPGDNMRALVGTFQVCPELQDLPVNMLGLSFQGSVCAEYFALWEIFAQNGLLPPLAKAAVYAPIDRLQSRSVLRDAVLFDDDPNWFGTFKIFTGIVQETLEAQYKLRGEVYDSKQLPLAALQEAIKHRDTDTQEKVRTNLIKASPGIYYDVINNVMKQPLPNADLRVVYAGNDAIVHEEHSVAFANRVKQFKNNVQVVDMGDLAGHFYNQHFRTLPQFTEGSMQ